MTTNNDLLTAAKRSDLCMAKDVTLDGQPAQISGPRWGYARVTDRNGRGIDATWPHVEATVNRGGRFFSTRY
ncbi:MAG TPA: hypothetical protein VGH54_23435 [Mycobacterium sp.]|jgi:hypothetical protein|uniref:hypothetical protein n=1 Tax=Mycobacterium sp. TaxID=1785 RepID=UPI002F422663